MRWIRKKTDEQAAEMLVREAGLPPIAERILAGRGATTAADADRFLTACVARHRSTCS